MILDESEVADTDASDTCCSSSRAVGEAVGTSPQFWSLLASLLQQAGTALPTVIAEIYQLISALHQHQHGRGRSRYGIQPRSLNALAGLLQKAAAELPTILPVILQLITFFGGTVNVTPAATPAS